MVRVNGVESAAVFMNMYPDPSVGKNVIHLHISAPNSETALWGADDALTIEADWRQEFGWCQIRGEGGIGKRSVLLFGAGQI